MCLVVEILGIRIGHLWKGNPIVKMQVTIAWSYNYRVLHERMAERKDIHLGTPIGIITSDSRSLVRENLKSKALLAKA